MTTADTSATPLPVVHAAAEGSASTAYAEGALRAPPPSLKKLAVRGAAWTIVGYGAGQVLRFGSNLVLTRLLFPEAFGLMALVNVVLQGLQMFSDMGIGPSIIQNPRGEDPKFLNTAWSIQVFRGFMLWGICCAVAYPVALFYNEPMLWKMLPLAGCNAIIAGFNSPALFTANRKLALGRLTVLDVFTQVVSITVMVIWAWLVPTVWALLGGALVGSVLKMLGTHLWLPGNRCRLEWERDAFRGLIRFGRWIFISTICGFILSRADRIVLGKLFTLGELGVYSIALMLVLVPVQVFGRLSQTVLFPILTRFREEPPAVARRKTLRMRLLLLGGLLPIMCGLIVAGDYVIRLLYEPEYHAAGWMLRVLMAGYLIRMIPIIGPVHLAHGNAHYGVFSVGSEAILVLGSMFVGNLLGGAYGIVWGVAAGQALTAIVFVVINARHGLWIAWLDFAAWGTSALLVGLGLLVRHGVLHASW